jgi:hypothetical protein
VRQGVYESTTLIAVVLLLLILFVSVGYFFLIPQPGEPPHQSTLIRALQQNQSVWENSRPLSYRYVVQRSCYCSKEYVTPYIVTEESGRKTAEFLVSVETGTGEFLSEPPEPVWISDIFGELTKAIESEVQPVVEVIYDGRYGYPASVDIQYPQPDTNMRYDIRDFEVLEYR